jgi:COP9 signalosome complex subunit 5
LTKSVKDRFAILLLLDLLLNDFFSSTKIAVEAQHGLIAQVLKDVIFSMRPNGSGSTASSKVADVTDMAIG